MLDYDWDLWFRRLEGNQCVINPATQHQKNPHLLWKEGKKQFGNNWANLQKRVMEIFALQLPQGKKLSRRWTHWTNGLVPHKTVLVLELLTTLRTLHGLQRPWNRLGFRGCRVKWTFCLMCLNPVDIPNDFPTIKWARNGRKDSCHTRPLTKLLVLKTCMFRFPNDPTPPTWPLVIHGRWG